MLPGVGGYSSVRYVLSVSEPIIDPLRGSAIRDCRVPHPLAVGLDCRRVPGIYLDCVCHRRSSVRHALTNVSAARFFVYSATLIRSGRQTFTSYCDCQNCLSPVRCQGAFAAVPRLKPRSPSHVVTGGPDVRQGLLGRIPWTSRVPGAPSACGGVRLSRGQNITNQPRRSPVPHHPCLHTNGNWTTASHPVTSRVLVSPGCCGNS